MAVPMGQFRSALHGFNRSDVAQFIQALTSEHERKMRMLREENLRLQEQIAALEEAAQNAKPDEAQPQSSEKPAEPETLHAQELAAYRRAEQSERKAQERAARSAEQMKQIYAQAERKLQRATQDIGAVTATIGTSFAELQTLLLAARATVDGTSEELAAACTLAQME